jgi:hypothetical protein
MLSLAAGMRANLISKFSHKQGFLQVTHKDRVRGPLR